MMATIYKKILAVLNLIRYWQWQDKVQDLTIAALILFSFGNSFLGHSYVLVIYILSLYFPFAYGYLLNSYMDREDDAKVQRDFLKGFSTRTVVMALVFIAVGTLGVALFFNNFAAFMVVLIELLLATVYSMRPYFLKGRGVWGILASSICQRLPFLVFLPLFSNQSVFILYLFGWLVLIGLLIELAHQYGDYKNDSMTNTSTYLVYLGLDRGRQLIVRLRLLLIFYIFAFVWVVPLSFFHKTLLILLLVVFSQESIRFTLTKFEELEKLLH